MTTLENVEELEKAKACVEFALQKLEDVWHIEAALLRGATSISEASYVMASVQTRLRKIQPLLVAAALCREDDKYFSTVQEWITTVVHVCVCTERTLFNFLNQAGKTIPDLRQAVKRISTKPVDLFSLNMLAIVMKEIKSLLNKITNDDVVKHLNGDGTVQASLQPAWQFPVPNIRETGLVDIYEALQKTIIDTLIDPNNRQCLQVAIVGPEASGKTTLVQKIYQSTAVKNHFDICFWLFDMNRFDYQRPELFKPIDILRKMLTTLELGNSSNGDDDETCVIPKIHEYLKVKRYLVVIDNVQRYNVFKKVLPSENNGSRVLIASQKMGHYETLCLDLDPVEAHKLPCLSKEEKLKIIFRKPFDQIKDSLEEYPPDLLPTAEIIAASSWGDSPMNLLLLSGHILFNQPFSQTRLQVLGDIAAPATFNEILSSIYTKMPVVLQTCFAYMAALFPVNFLIHANSLIRLWIAEGMIPKEDGRTKEEIWEKAELYLDKLIQRGFVRDIWTYYHNQPNKPIRVVVIHPMLQSGLFDIYTSINVCPPIKIILGEDALDKSGFYGEADDNRENVEQLVASTKFSEKKKIVEQFRRLALHISYKYDQFSSFQEGKKLHGFKYPSLHSLFFFGSVAPLVFSEFHFLRVLTVFKARIQFGDEGDRSCWLEGLINLRYLGFIVCLLKGGSLGKILSRLSNLQTLDLSESSVSGLSEFKEHNPNINVIDPIDEELQGCWSPVPDMTQ